MRARAWLALVATLTTNACSAALMKLPAGSGVPAADAAVALQQSTAACRAVKTFSAEVAVSGKIGGRRVRGRLLAGLAVPDSTYLEAPAPFGAPLFTLATESGSATLVLPRDQRVLERGQPEEVLEAVTGVPLSPQDLRAAMTGCADIPSSAGTRSFADGWIVASTPALDAYVRRQRSVEPWRLVAVVRHDPGRPAWRAEYRNFTGDLPRSLRLVSVDAGRFDLNLALSQVDINVPLGPETFRLRIPDGVTPITVDELRDAGPLAAPSGDR